MLDIKIVYLKFCGFKDLEICFFENFSKVKTVLQEKLEKARIYATLAVF